MASDENRIRYFNSGTTISFDLGYIINPPSFRESESFSIKTFLQSDSGVNYYYINRVTAGLTIKNTVKGQLNNLNIMQSEDAKELGAKTKLRITF